MVIQCMFCGSKRESGGKTYHRFPLKDEQLLKSWLQNMHLCFNFQPKKNDYLCSDHFEEKCFEKGMSRNPLRSGSVPTIFGEYKSVCVCCRAVKGRDKKSFHKFPLHNPELLRKWVAVMESPDFTPTEKSLICDDHFDEKCFRKKGQRFVPKVNAVPTLFTLSKDARSVETRESENSSPDQVNDVHSNYSITRQQGMKRISSELSTSLAKIQRSVSPCTTALLYDENRVATNRSLVERCDKNTAPSTSSAGEIIDNPVCSRTPETPTTFKNRVLQMNHDHQYDLTPTTMRKRFGEQKKKIQALMKRSHVQKQHISRLTKKVTTLKEIVSELRRTRTLPDSGLECLDSIATTDVSQFLKRFINNQNKLIRNNDKENDKPKKRAWKSQRKNNNKGISREQYPAALRSFAMTLHFYSPKAYGFVRRKFCQALPDPSTLRSWYSAIDGAPGFTSESFQALKQKVAEAKKVDKKVLVSFQLDEISIKKFLQRLRNGNICEQVDFGSDIESNLTIPLAKDALVLMVVSVDGSWKIPVGYFLINGIDSNTNSGLITEALQRLHEIEIEVFSVTLDGPSEHFATMRALGASFDLPDIRPYFLHPSNGEKIHVIFDACHMLKLVRNTLGDSKILKDSDGNSIEWKFIESLAVLQETEGLRAGNRLKMAHIRYWKMKMKVALAAQTLSDSVADAIEFCDKYLGLKDFKGSEATVRFIRIVNRIFDFLNSRNPLGKGFKAPLKKSNEAFWRSPLLSYIQYLQGLTDVVGTPMIRTRRYVAFVGFITAIESMITIFDSHVKPEGSQLKYLLTYKFSQDHLELFFCAIRSCGGWCPNPTARQFMSAYKRLLVNHEVQAVNGNAEAMDSTSILTVASTRPVTIDRYDPNVYEKIANIRVMKKYDLEDLDEENKSGDLFFEEFGNFMTTVPQLSTFSRACIGYIAGWVVRKLTKKQNAIVQCETCRNALLQDSQNLAQFEQNALIEVKTNRGLLFPSESVVRICENTEKLLRHSLDKLNGMIPFERNFPALVCSKVLHDLVQPPCTLFLNLNDHMFDDAANDSNHIYLLSKQVCKAYLELRMYAATKIASEKIVGTKIRHHLTRQIIWERQ